MARLTATKNFLTLALLVVSDEALACATCGLNNSFTPMTLLISFGFFLLPLILVTWIGFKIYRDSKLNVPKDSTETKSL